MYSSIDEIIDRTGFTNGDSIRAMTDEELAAWMMNNLDGTCRFCIPTMRTNERCDGHCVNGITAWLKQPVEEEE